MTQYRYFSKASQMTAILKQDMHRVRASNPKRLSPKNEQVLFRLNRVGDQIPNGLTHVQLSQPISPRERHELAWKKD